MILDFLQQYPFILAFIVGFIPALIWMWFWLKEDAHPEPAKMITLSFLGGALAVFPTIYLQEIVYDKFHENIWLSFTLWASIEEVLKFVFVYFIVLRIKKIADEPIDNMIYLIISAIGFITFENTLFLIPSISNAEFIDTIIHSNMRFVGASLLHITASGALGTAMALSFYKTLSKKIIYVILGMMVAIVLHTAFNLFIMKGVNVLFVFVSVWVAIVVLLLMFEKVKHMRHI